jgi:hypothetical protein
LFQKNSFSNKTGLWKLVFFSMAMTAENPCQIRQESSSFTKISAKLHWIFKKNLNWKCQSTVFTTGPDDFAYYTQLTLQCKFWSKQLRRRHFDVHFIRTEEWISSPNISFANNTLLVIITN